MTGNNPWPMIVDVLNGKAGESGKEKEEEAHFQQSTRFKLSIPIECVPGDLLLSFVFLKLAHRQSSPASRETRKDASTQENYVRTDIIPRAAL